MKLFNSKAATIAAAALIVTFAGGTGAYAGTLITGAQIKNGTIQSQDLAADSVKTSDLADNAVKSDQLAPNSVDESNIQDGSVTTEALEPTAEAAVEEVAAVLSSENGVVGNALVATWKSGMASNQVTAKADSNMMVYLDVQVTDAPTDDPVTVFINQDRGDPIFCVAQPVNGFGSCQAARRATDMELLVQGSDWDRSYVDVEVNVVQVVG